jgi:hypothetical protein
VRSFKWIAGALFAGSICAQPLPKAANVLVDGRFVEVAHLTKDEPYCSEVKESPDAIRRCFVNFHPVTPPQMHALYSFVGCGVHGRILYQGKTYHWKFYITEEIETDFPDGKTRMLAGKPDPQAIRFGYRGRFERP